jgi:hypothetical protein
MRVHGGRFGVSLPRNGTDTWPVHCAGPLHRDLPPLVTPRLSLAQVLHGVSSAFVSRREKFANDGWSGTVTEHLSVSAGPSKGLGDVSHPVRNRHQRTVEATFRVAPMQGAVDVVWSHVPSGCATFDACRLHGTERLVPRGLSNRPALLHVWATGPAKRPERDYLTALGLARGGNPKGLAVTGIGTGGYRLGVDATTEQPRTRCEAANDAQVSAVAFGDKAGYRLSLRSLVPTDPLRTSCPGPALGGRLLTRLRLVPGSLAARQVTLNFDTPREYREQDYHVAIDPNLTLAMTRLRVTNRVGALVPFSRRSVLSGDRMMH